MIKVEENYATEFYYLSLLWRYDHLKVQLCYAFLSGQYNISMFYVLRIRNHGHKTRACKFSTVMRTSSV